MKQEFEIIRKNVLANPNLYSGRYTQKNRKEAYIEFLEDSLRRLECDRDLESLKESLKKSLKELLKDLLEEFESLIDEARSVGSYNRTKYYKGIYKVIEEELKKLEEVRNEIRCLQFSRG